MRNIADEVLLKVLKLGRPKYCLEVNVVRKLVRASNDVFNDTLNSLINEGFIHRGIGNAICLRDPVRTLLHLLRKGYSSEEIVKLINWQLFEGVVASILNESGLQVYKNVRIPPPRGVEVDVLGINIINWFAYVIDCKHWMRAFRLSRRVKDITNEHYERVLKLNNRCEWLMGKVRDFYRVRYLIPVIVTAMPINVKVLNNVFIVPIRYLNDFLINTLYYIDLLNVKPVPNRCRVK